MIRSNRSKDYLLSLAAALDGVFFICVLHGVKHHCTYLVKLWELRNPYTRIGWGQEMRRNCVNSKQIYVYTVSIMVDAAILIMHKVAVIVTFCCCFF